ncbi:MAG: HypC/HybG/HupF family hydrogenase formation chaperone [Nanoarchaeota archaeon]
MCLAVPGKIVRIKKGIATVDYGVEKRQAAVLGDEFCIGDYVIVSGKVVIQKIPEKEALEALKFYAEAVAKE